MILGDCLLVMASLAEREGGAAAARCRCIYMDPPTAFVSTQIGNRRPRIATFETGMTDSVSREPEVVRAFRDTWKEGIHSYLSYLRDRLHGCAGLAALVSGSGSIFVQIGDENVHTVRASLLDEVFGARERVADNPSQEDGVGRSRHLGFDRRCRIWYARDISGSKIVSLPGTARHGRGRGRITGVNLLWAYECPAQELKSANCETMRLHRWIGVSRRIGRLVTGQGLWSRPDHGAGLYRAHVQRGAADFPPPGQTVGTANVNGMQRLSRAGQRLPPATPCGYQVCG